MMWDYGYLSGAGWIFMTVLMVVFIAAVVVAIVFIVRALDGGAQRLHDQSSVPHDQRRGDALEILERRYASGEIDREEYLQKRQDLAG